MTDQIALLEKQMADSSKHLSSSNINPVGTTFRIGIENLELTKSQIGS